MSRHDLVVGGTGMLRAVVEHLLGDGSRLTVLARGRHGFGGLVDSPSAATGMLQCVVVDYTDDVAFAGALRAAIAERGAPARAVAWIHDDTAPRALGILADALASSDGNATLWEVVGSVDESLSAVAARRRDGISSARLDHRQALLGYAPGPPWRWLTNREIADGVSLRSPTVRPRPRSASPSPGRRGDIKMREGGSPAARNLAG